MIMIIGSCNTSSVIEQENGESVDLIGTISMQQMKAYWDNPLAERFIKSDLKVYKLLYESIIDGIRIPLSGAVIVPENTDIKGIISIQHATFFADEEAPSENGQFSVVSRKAIFAANGYAVFLPDYLGYGVDGERLHPYHHASTLALASHDMILAGQELLATLELTVDKKIFLAGYSEGAYATAALQQYIDDNSNLDIDAISLGSGSYDLKATMDVLVDAEMDDSACLPCNAFFIQAYHEYYKMDKELSYYFKAPYAALIEEGLLKGEYSSLEISQQLTNNPKMLFQDAFLEDYRNGIPEWDEALDENSIHDWNINVPALITHNISDQVSPYFNSELLAMKNNQSQNVSFQAIPGTNHFDGIFIWGIMTMDYFDKF